MFSSPLRRAIARGIKPGGDLAGELRKLDNNSIRSKKDAKAICDALAALSLQDLLAERRSSSPLHALTSLFQDVDSRDAPAFPVLYQEGIAQLIRIFDAVIHRDDKHDADTLLFVLKILAMYGSPKGAAKVVEAARLPLDPDDYMWHVILGEFSEGHPQRNYVFRALSDPLPSGFVAVALLDSANKAAIEGELRQHPFNSMAGWEKLRSWLEDSDPDHASYAHSATAALPFVSNPARDQLLGLAMEHANTGVQIEAAWAAGKLGREAGLKVLARFCMDLNHSVVAQRYLAELDREDLIPIEARNASFQAMAEFAGWLAHPNELGTPPDELEIVDHRQLAWPPECQLKPFWLIQYRMRDRTGLEDDDVDCGLVGSMTWCFFSYKMNQRTPEDVYAIHCYWEMQNAGLIDDNEVTDASEYAGLLSQWQGSPIESASVIRLAELSPKLKTPSRLVALVTAKKAGQEGWIALDGPRSTWYPKDEQPDETFEKTLLMIHVGRQLLGFQNPSDRKKYLITDRPHRSPQDAIAAYEKLLSEASHCTPKRQKELLGSESPLERHFGAYVDAIVAVGASDKPDTLIRVYELFLKMAAQADESIVQEVYDSFSVLGENFDAYVDALISRDRLVDVCRLVGIFAAYWDHNLDYAKLGTAAFKAGNRAIAEEFLLKLQRGLDSCYGSEEMGMLAEIWHDRGELDAARELLVDCLQKLAVEIKQSTDNSDRKALVDEFHHHRSTYLRLFPRGENELAARGVPAEPI